MTHSLTPELPCFSHLWHRLPVTELQTRLVEHKRRRTNPSPDPLSLINEAELAIEAMTQISEAMNEAEALSETAQQNHLAAFEKHMQQLLGVDAIEMEEPYLEGLLAEASLNYIKRLERQLTPLETFAQTALADAETIITGVEPASAPVAKSNLPPLTRACFIPDSLKKLDFGKEIKPQIDASIDNEKGWAGRWLNQRLDEHRQTQLGIRRYRWNTLGDDKVRSSHAVNDGKIFSWDSPPTTGHPGHDYNCRCTAIPLAQGFEPDDGFTGAEGVEVAGLDKIALAAALAKLAQTAAKTKELKNIVKRVKDTLISKPPKAKQIPKGKIFQRPKGVPKEWVKRASNNGKGVKYVDPKNKHNDIRIQKGNPNNSNAAQQKDYVKWKKNGQHFDRNGNPVSGESPEAHIPIENFKFDPRIFK